MARTMTEKELLEFHEINRRLSSSLKSKGQLADAERHAGLMCEIEKHLYKFADERASVGSRWDPTERP